MEIKSWSNIKALRAQAPELFVEGYPRLVQAPFQPQIIPRDHVVEWRDKTFVDDGKEHKFQVMPFPPLPNPLTVDPHDERVKYWFVPSEQAIRHDCYYLCVKRNTSLSNADSYPLLPACCKRDVLSDPTSLYHQWVNGTFVQLKLDSVSSERKKDQKPVYSIGELRQIAKQLGIPTLQNKAQLAEAILAHVQSESKSKEELETKKRLQEAELARRRKFKQLDLYGTTRDDGKF